MINISKDFKHQIWDTDIVWEHSADSPSDMFEENEKNVQLAANTSVEYVLILMLRDCTIFPFSVLVVILSFIDHLSFWSDRSSSSMMHTQKDLV